MLRTTFCLGVFVSVGCPLFADGPTPRTEMVTLSDGVKLATDVYLPPGKGPWPVILVRSPYGKSSVAGAWPAVLWKGYAMVSQDMRGRGKSEGKPVVIFHNDGWGKRRDGQETLEWVAKQPWCNGKVATWGASALGIAQNMTAPGAPSCLKAQYVGVAFSDMYSQGAYQGGAWRLELLEGWLKSQGILEGNLAHFVSHPRYDSFWKEVDADAQAERVDAPGLFHGGWYDIFLQGTINSFVNIQHRGGPNAKGKCRLVIGPIAHGGFDELSYPNSNPPPEGDFFGYFDLQLQGKGKPASKPVHYYLMGDPTDKKAPGNKWKAAEDWPPPAKATPFYFHSDGRLVRDKSPAGDDKRTYSYDPKNPVPTVGGQNLGIKKGPMDQRKVEDRPDVLLFTTDVLESPLTIVGRIKAKLFVESDQPDTDFTVKLCDVYPDGRSMLVTDGILRARFRKGFDREVFLKPGVAEELEVDLWSTALVLNKGHRLRIAVSSSNSPRFEPNPNTGKPFRADKEMRVAKNTIHLAAGKASCVVLPVEE